MAKDFGFNGKKADSSFQKFISEPELIRAWAKFHDSSHHLKDTKGKKQGLEYGPLSALALKAFENAAQWGVEPTSEKEKVSWTMDDHRLHFMARFMGFVAQPGKIWAGHKITRKHFLKVANLLRFILAEMSLTGQYKIHSATRKTILKALEEHGITLAVPIRLAAAKPSPQQISSFSSQIPFNPQWPR